MKPLEILMAVSQKTKHRTTLHNYTTVYAPSQSYLQLSTCHKPRVTWEKGTLIKEFPPLCWPLNMSMRIIFYC